MPGVTRSIRCGYGNRVPPRERLLDGVAKGEPALTPALDRLHLYNRAQVVAYALRHRLVESSTGG